MNPLLHHHIIKQTAWFGILAAQLLSSNALASEPSPLVVTAGRIAENPANVSSDISVISRQDIEDAQASNVADLLRTQAGIDVASSGGMGKATSVFVRGGSSGHVLVLIDGVRVGSVTLGSFDWANLSTADIERIEIVRGAQSSLYGADAMAGVIQIFTRKGTNGVQTQVFAEAGTYGTKSMGYSVQVGTPSGVSLSLSADTLSSDGFSVAAKGTEADAYQRTTLSGRVGIKVGKGSVDLTLRRVDATSDLDGSIYNPATFTSSFQDVLNYSQTTTQNVSSVQVVYPFSDTLESTLQISRSTDDAVTSGSAPGASNSDFKTTVDQLTLENHLDLETASVLFGLDIHKDNGKSTSAGFDETVTQQALFASFANSYDMLDVNASVRYDDNSVSSNQTTYKLGSVAHLAGGLSVSVNYGTGFKAPTINDLFYPKSGNPNLEPETSKSWDVGIKYNIENHMLKADFSAVYFEQTYHNLIVWAPAPTLADPFRWIPQNVNSASTKGTELTANISNTLGFLRFNWTTLSAKDDGTGLWLALRAQDSGSITLGSNVAGLHVELQTQVVGKRFSDTKNKKVLDKYNKTDLRLSYAFNPTWKLKFRVENIEDTVYEEVSGYAVAGRSTYAGINATF